MNIPSVLVTMQAFLDAAFSAVSDFLIHMSLTLLGIGIICGVIYFVIRCEQEKLKDEQEDK